MLAHQVKRSPSKFQSCVQFPIRFNELHSHVAYVLSTTCPARRPRLPNPSPALRPNRYDAHDRGPDDQRHEHLQLQDDVATNLPTTRHTGGHMSQQPAQACLVDPRGSSPSCPTSRLPNSSATMSTRVLQDHHSSGTYTQHTHAWQRLYAQPTHRDGRPATNHRRHRGPSLTGK